MSAICAASLTSALTLNVRRPSSLQSASTSFAWAMRLRSTIAMSAPSDAIARAYAAPIPWAPPVTMHTLSSKRSPIGDLLQSGIRSAELDPNGEPAETRLVDVDPRRDVILTGIGGQGIQLC